MLDNHYTPEGYGIKSNFVIGKVKISSYTTFVLLGIIIGVLWFYFTISKKRKLNYKYSYFIVMSALLGGLLGSKLLVFIENISILIKHPSYIKYFILTGKSIVGGLLGGLLGIKAFKKIAKLETFHCGNEIAPAIALAMGIGRIGCFLTGCCYGIKTTLPIGVDFGDGIRRIPTQLIEMLFCFILFGILFYRQKKNKDLPQGILFRELVLYYFIFRFFIEFIRDTNKNILFLSIYQVISIIGIILMLLYIKKLKSKHSL